MLKSSTPCCTIKRLSSKVPMRETLTPKERLAKAKWLLEHMHPDDKEELERIRKEQELNKIIDKSKRRQARIEQVRRDAYEWDMVAPWVDKERGTSDHPEIPGW